MSGKTFINLPVKDLNKSIEFFSALGFEFDRRFTDENATCMVLGADSYAMLLVEPFFQQFTGKKLVDAADSTEAIVTILLDSRHKIIVLTLDRLVEMYHVHWWRQKKLRILRNGNCIRHDRFIARHIHRATILPHSTLFP